MEIYLTYPTSEGSREIRFDGEKLTFGRGSDADYRFEDDGLSRLHSTIYRDGERVWIVDENSTNGTFVNGEKVGASGTPLHNGDTVKIGHYTNLKIRFAESEISAAAVSAGNSQTSSVVSSSANKSSNFLPLVITAFALLVITVSAVFIGVKVFGKKEVVKNDNGFDTPREFDNENNNVSTPTPTPKTEKTSETNSVEDNSILTDSPESNDNPAGNNLPSGKKYSEMSDAERGKYIEAKALKVARMIGNSESKTIPPAAVEKIKSFVNAYASRANVKPLGGCRFGDNLQATYERASKNAPFIIKAFNSYGIDPQIGLYLAMIESEHCVCLQSPTGPLGMFQFTFATAKIHFKPSEGVIKGASPSNPDIRCQPAPAADAAGSYMKALTLRFGTGPLSVPLAIGSYNSGEGGLSTNLKTALESNETQERSFWTLVANADKLSKQFQLENVKYVPKFFAAAIVGENPRDFGLNLQPLSTYAR
ncbi:hypothetical protein BH20ACI4_BH20ACI4_15910 [soil metagenome]